MTATQQPEITILLNLSFAVHFAQQVKSVSFLSVQEIVLNKWSQNPYVRGSWSDPVIGTDSSVHANMAGRLKNLFFAGEATDGDWYGFMQGAYYSGLKGANEIASCIQGKKCDAYQPTTGLPLIVKGRPSDASYRKPRPISVMSSALIFLYCFLSITSNG